MPSKYSITMDEVDQLAPEMAWDDFLVEFGGTPTEEGDFQWRIGEHVCLVGNTNSGKSTLALSILPIRKNIVAFGTKPQSETLQRFITEAKFQRIAEWNPKLPAVKMRRRLLWPPIRSENDNGKVRSILWRALDDIFYNQHNWCVYVDELPELSQALNLDIWIKRYLRQGRELGISFVVAMQRPKYVPLDVYTNSTHLFLWAEKDETNIDRISGISSIDAYTVAGILTTLKPHQFLYINTRLNGDNMVRSMTPPPKGG